MSSKTPDPVLNEYFAECEELSERVSQNLQLIEKGHANPDTIDSIYRDIHTIKGSSQLFGFKDIGEITHAMESCLDPVRKNQLTPSPTLLELLYKSLDSVDEMLRVFKADQSKDFSPVLTDLVPKLIEASLALSSPVLSVVPNDPSPVMEEPAATSPEVLPAPATTAPMLALVEEPDPVDAIVPAIAEVAFEAVPELEVAAIVPEPVLAPTPITIAEVQKPAASNNTHSEPAAETSSIRVSVALLDKLMTLMGEMVLVRNQVLQYANHVDDLEFMNLSQRLDVVTSEIQGEVMKTRMQPIGNVLTKFQRVVRDLARDLGKKIELELSGTETELDKTLLEAVKDPLMHIVRNSCDHGVETIEDRRASGKGDTGTISIRSFHEGGQVIVEIADDGRGLHREKLIKKAVEKGILTAEKGAALSDREVFALIFAPGFSTAAQVTNVSGRGVGMDVVKNNIEGIGGNVEIQSVVGKGTTTRLKIPLTLAIVPAMIVRCQTERFAIPQVKLVELVRVEKGTGPNQIEFLQGKPIYRLRGNLLPLVTLDETLGLVTANSIHTNDISNIVVLNAEGMLFGLIVDEVLDTAEVVVKPMSSFLKNLSVYSGATVLGDGTIALILDVVGIARQQQLLSETNTKTAQFKGSEEENFGEMQEFLLFRLNSQTKHALPLNLVHRLEEFSRKSIEMSGGQRVVRYRNSVLPIISLNSVLGFSVEAKDQPLSDTISVIVSQKSSRMFGIEVNEILDVLTTLDSLDDRLADRAGLLGNLVTDNEIIVVVDVLHILDEAVKKLNVGTQIQQKVEQLKGVRILFAEDTTFFRKMVCSTLVNEGAIMTTAMDGREALDILEKSQGTEFDLVLSDIEMPKLNGLQLAAAVRLNLAWKDIPMIALTTRFNAEYAKEGVAAGFTSYLEKLKPEILINEIKTLLKDQKNNQRRAS